MTPAQSFRHCAIVRLLAAADDTPEHIVTGERRAAWALELRDLDAELGTMLEARLAPPAGQQARAVGAQDVADILDLCIANLAELRKREGRGG